MCTPLVSSPGRSTSAGGRGGRCRVLSACLRASLRIGSALNSSLCRIILRIVGCPLRARARAQAGLGGAQAHRGAPQGGRTHPPRVPGADAAPAQGVGARCGGRAVCSLFGREVGSVWGSLLSCLRADPATVTAAAAAAVQVLGDRCMEYAPAARPTMDEVLSGGCADGDAEGWTQEVVSNRGTLQWWLARCASRCPASNKLLLLLPLPPGPHRGCRCRGQQHPQRHDGHPAAVPISQQHGGRWWRLGARLRHPEHLSGLAQLQPAGLRRPLAGRHAAVGPIQVVRRAHLTKHTLVLALTLPLFIVSHTAWSPPFPPSREHTSQLKRNSCALALTLSKPTHVLVSAPRPLTPPPPPTPPLFSTVF